MGSQMQRDMSGNDGQRNNHRYSYVNTPIEVQRPTFQSRRSGHKVPALQDVVESYSSPMTNYQSQSSSPAPMNRMQPHSASRTSPSHSSTLPPLPQLPVHLAPYALNPEVLGQTGYPMIQCPQPSASPTSPVSPGPLPVKHNPEAEVQERREKDLSIVPDDNPLASPTSTSSFGAKRTAQTETPWNSVNVAGNHLPGQVMHPSQEIRGGTWTSGLCECTDPGVCCMGLWCPCILYGRTQYRLSRKSERKDPTNMLGYETCNASCTLMALLCGCQWLLATIQHSRTRRAYGIPGGIPTDCIRATCCTCCTLTQDEREIKAREESSRRTVAGTTFAAPYAPPHNMSFSPPPR